ncbi:alpha-ketoglutarate-dependent dioxygenase AlkB [Microvirga sp. GCM10011540]|uniref:alpha-ketoglutarate-dependent dioxygenase AlkB n=1 Tax=Microvirga sp. GCM10011540 TaxID=3317338 RepID=UPI0036240EC4
MSHSQPDLFRAPPSLPEEFRYQPDFLSTDEELGLVDQFAALPFKAFEFRGYRGNRRVLSFGWQYDFNRMELQRTEDMPAFLLPLRERAARFASLEAAEFQHVLLTEYSAGAGIGWHKDKPMFAEVVGISLGSPCVFRFRRKVGSKWERASVVTEPRSVYLLQGPSRTEWEHSIPAVDSQRYSVTFRNFKPSHQPER